MTEESLNLISQYKYMISVSILFTDEIVTLDAPQVAALVIDNKYEENFLPVTKLSISLTNKEMIKLQEQKTKVKFKISINKVEFLEDRDPDKTYFSSFDTFGEDIITDMVFQPIYIDCTKNPLEELENHPSRVDEDKTNESNEYSRTTDVYLFNTSHFDKSKTIVNTVLNNVDIYNAIGYILNKIGCDSVIIDNPNNSTAYRQIVIPPLQFASSIYYLQNVYGIYKLGLRLYQDFNYLYILSKDLTTVNVSNKEYENVLINIADAANDTPFNLGCYTDHDNKRYVIRLNNDVTIIPEDQLNKEIYGNDIKVLSIQGIKKAFNYSNGSFNIGTGYEDSFIDMGGNEDHDKTKYYYNKYDNQYIVEELKAEIQNTISLTANFQDFDYEIFTPNRRYFFEFESDNMKEFNGRYRLERNVAIFNKNTGEQDLFSYFGRCIFRSSGRDDANVTTQTMQQVKFN